MEKWKTLFEAAQKINVPKDISSFISSGTYTCALETENGNIYTGINVITTSELNTSAEVNAILNMISHGESKITKMLILNELDEIVMPSEDAIKCLLELDMNLEETKLIKSDTEVISLADILPDWWGTLRLKKD